MSISYKYLTEGVIIFFTRLKLKHRKIIKNKKKNALQISMYFNDTVNYLSFGNTLWLSAKV